MNIEKKQNTQDDLQLKVMLKNYAHPERHKHA